MPAKSKSESKFVQTDIMTELTFQDVTAKISKLEADVAWLIDQMNKLQQLVSNDVNYAGDAERAELVRELEDNEKYQTYLEHRHSLSAEER